MAYDEVPGPSKTKKQRLNVKHFLSELENSSSDEDLDCDSVVYWGDSDDELCSDDDVVSIIQKQHHTGFIEVKYELCNEDDIVESVTGKQNRSDYSTGNIDEQQINTSTDDTCDTTVNFKISESNLSTNFAWSSGPPNLKNIDFVGRPGLRVQIPSEGKPIDFFNLIADDEFFSLILTATNLYGDILKNKTRFPRSRMLAWKLLKRDELQIFLGLILHMGNIRLNRVKDYWLTHRLYKIPCFHNYMGRNRFMMVLRCIYFCKNFQDELAPKDRLYKIRPLLDFFNKKISSLYYPNKELCIGESMMLWRGHLIFRKYIQNTKNMYGIKLYLLTEPDGTILKIKVCTGYMDETGGKGYSANVVLHLMEEHLKAGHSLYMDNFYNSYHLSKKLLHLDTHTTGILRSKRKDTPDNVTNAKLKTGESVCQYSEGVGIGKWRDIKEVLYISTEHENVHVETVNKKGNAKEKPKPIAQCNNFMSGIDHQDQMLLYYPVPRKNIRWYQKLGIHIIEMMLLNAFKLYCKTKAKIPFQDFRLAVIEELLPVRASRQEDQPDSIVVKKNHFMAKCKVSDEGRKLRKKCRQCAKKNKRRDSMYYCKTCPDSPGLCFECFETYHS